MKSFAAILIRCLAVFNRPLVETPQPTMTQQMPENTSHALMFRNVPELKERGGEFAEEMGFKGEGPMLLSMVRAQLMVKG